MGSSEIIRDEYGPNLHEMAQKLVTDYFPEGSSEILRDEAGPNFHEMVQNSIGKTLENDACRSGFIIHLGSLCFFVVFHMQIRKHSPSRHQGKVVFSVGFLHKRHPAVLPT